MTHLPALLDTCTTQADNRFVLMLGFVFQIIVLGLFSVYPPKEYASDQQQDDGYDILEQGHYALQKNRHPRTGRTIGTLIL